MTQNQQMKELYKWNIPLISSIAPCNKISNTTYPIRIYISVVPCDIPEYSISQVNGIFL
jgi:hypothetical protein